MNKLTTLLIVFSITFGVFSLAPSANAQSYTSDSRYGTTYGYDFRYNRTPQYSTYYYTNDYNSGYYYSDSYINSLIQQLNDLIDQLEDLKREQKYYYNDRRNDDYPDVDTRSADDVDEDSAELNGYVDMNDYNNGRVFFVYGEDEDQVEDIEDDYDEYRDIDEDGDDLQKVTVDTDHDGRKNFSKDITGLDDDTRHYFSMCVEFEDEDDDERIICGGVEDFETDQD